MSHILVNAYLAEIDRLKRVSGKTTEQVVREAFKDLLKAWSKSAGLIFVAELEHETAFRTKVYPDGTILHDIRVPLGFWEAKDSADDLDAEIAKKFAKGYPKDNILFEDTATAVLWQNGREVLRASMTDVPALDRLVSLFFAWERPEIAQFRAAVEQFKADLPSVLDALRAKIDAAYKGNKVFRAAAATFLGHARETINPGLSEADVREMLIQHVLTEDIFAHVYNEGDFHRLNNIAEKLYALEGAFFTGGVKKDTLKALEPYYAAIRANAAQITSHLEKQAFLKVIYENFYKVYNPKAADRLGVVYTPNEIVRFMVQGADWLTHKHFGRTLIDDHVEILDPATGTFICELIEHFRGQPEKLARKYKHELHANEVAILPYYVANLNIEATYAAATGQYGEFENLCFVDTLDNVGGLGIKSGHQHDLFAALSDENVERVKRQNKRKISVIIGNPPYNANQANENDNNKNRAYPHIDGLIKRSFVKLSTAQKTKVYDMYARFFRWASDRMHDDGVIAFVTNRSFIDSRTFDGFRRYAMEHFNEIHLIDLKGNARASGEQRRREGGNVFDNQIRVGIAVSFFVRKRAAKGCKVYYQEVPDYWKSDEKLAFLSATPLSDRKMTLIEPDAKANWINQNENDWDDLIPVADKKTKAAKVKGQERAVFKLFSLGISSNRDQWVYDPDRTNLIDKISFFLNELATATDGFPATIKSSRNLKRRISQGLTEELQENAIRKASYRPFYKLDFYQSNLLIDEQGSLSEMFPVGEANRAICFNHTGARTNWCFLAVDGPADLHFGAAIDAYQIVSRYRYTSTGERIDNITDWALKRFRDRYGKAAGVTKDAIFQYVYAALHDPVWRETYAINLRREFPRLPFHADFAKWAEWGARLMDLHIGYESVEPWPVARTDTPDARARAGGVSPRVILKSDPGAGMVTLDSETVLSGLPAGVWAYRLGNRSGVDWVLDQHKEKTPRDPTIRAKFDTYRFADHKEKVVDLIARVARVSVETVAIVEAMRGAAR